VHPSAPPEAWKPLRRAVRLAARPLERFLHIEAASGIVLLVNAAAAMVWANSPWASAYTALWHTPLGLRLGSFVFERPLEWLVNDGLMSIFFFVVGMEIRRESHEGELSSLRRAALPAAAALGGMIAPALLYLSVASAPATRSGWGVPMATDIAFAVGIMSLLGQRVPAALRVLLLALAVIDDLGAIVVIALFYSAGIQPLGLGVAALGLLAILVLQRLGVRLKSAYLAPALLAWAGVYAAGVHPTIAGVLVGLMTPVRAWLGPEGFVHRVRDELAGLTPSGASAAGSSLAELHAVRQHVHLAQREAVSPAEDLIARLHPWVAFGIMPLFALANAGVTLSSEASDASTLRVTLGVALGLIVGKPLGVLLACFVGLRTGLAQLPLGVGARHLLVLGLVAGIGFTMALFVAQLAFADARLLSAAKQGILAASLGVGLIGLAAGRILLTPHAAPGAAQDADEAERSTLR
jgi:Na+:H+ antiporter, NhaA family